MSLVTLFLHEDSHLDLVYGPAVIPRPSHPSEHAAASGEESVFHPTQSLFLFTGRAVPHPASSPIWMGICPFPTPQQSPPAKRAASSHPAMKDFSMLECQFESCALGRGGRLPNPRLGNLFLLSALANPRAQQEEMLEMANHTRESMV